MSATGTQPKKGDKYQVAETFDAEVVSLWKEPYWERRKRNLPRGLQFLIAYDPSASGIAVCCDPDPYAEWEPFLIDAEDMLNPDYSVCYFVIGLNDLEKRCTQLSQPSSN